MQVINRANALAGLAGAVLVALAGAGSTAANAWTDKPVRVVVPAPAGGTMDVIGRILGNQLSVDLGHPAIIDNKPGAGGGIGVQALLAAAADGQTIMVTASNVLTEIPHVLKTGFDPIKDVKPVAAVARATMVLVATAGAQPKDLKELVAYVKANPGKLSIASYSSGTSSHYAAMILNQRGGLDLQHVPFPGSPPALTQVIGGQIFLMFDGLVTSLPQIRAGKLKAYGVTAKSRSAHLADVPTFAELGYPEFDFNNWLGAVVSSSVPAETANRISLALYKAAAAPEVRKRLAGAGFEFDDPLTPAQLAQSVRAEFERNAAIVKTFNIKAD